MHWTGKHLGFFSKRFGVTPWFDSRADEMSLSSAGGIYTAVIFCKFYGIYFKMEPLHRVYKRDWRHNGLAPQLSIETWTLIVQYINHETFRVMSVFTDFDAPLIIGFEAQQLFTRRHCASRGKLTFSFLMTGKSYTLNVYICHLKLLKLRAFVDTIGFKASSDSFLTTESCCNLKLSFLAKCIHRYTHAPWKDVFSIVRKEGDQNLISKQSTRK